VDGGLKLRAHDAEDLAAISACVQDALVSSCDLSFLPAERRFILLLNRFRWEKAVRLRAGAGQGGAEDPTVAPEPERAFERVHCALCFEKVLAVKARGIDCRVRNRIFELLAIQPEAEGIILLFAGGAAIRLTVEELHCRLHDVGEGWPTQWIPEHSETEPTRHSF
jgi:hypothetical protein